MEPSIEIRRGSRDSARHSRDAKANDFTGGRHAGSLEALRVTRPEAVDLETIKFMSKYSITSIAMVQIGQYYSCLSKRLPNVAALHAMLRVGGIIAENVL
jgi:hypothetical protein